MTDTPDAGGSGFDLGALLESAQQMMAVQAESQSQVHEGVAGGGAVRVTVTGGLDFQSVRIRRDAVDPDDVEMLEDLVLAALHDAVARINAAQQAALGGFVPPGFGELLGAPEPDDRDE